MRRILGVLCGWALLITGCGGAAGDVGAEPPPTETATEGFPATIEAANGTVKISARPERIVSLSPTTTEMLFAVGAGDQVVAVEENSDYPEDVPVTDLSGFDPNLEAIAVYDPDLVVLTNDANDLLAGLERIDVPALLAPAAGTLEDVYDQLGQMGTATGNVAEADKVVADMRAEIDALVDQVPERSEAPTYYHELGPELFTVTSDTFAGEIYTLAGLENVADPADADGQAGGYPQLSAEFLIEADPDTVFLADTECCGETAETFAARPGFDTITAVEEGQVFELDDDVASRWGPRVVNFLEAVVTATEDLGS